jgi:cytochrome c oxidase subunit 2
MGLVERSLAQTGPRPERPHARADWKQMLGIGIVASILGIIAGLLIDWFPIAASEEAKPIDTLWDVLIIFSVPVFVGVTVVVMFSAMKFRMREGEEELDGPPIHGNTRLEVIWTAIPAIILVGLCTYAFIVLEDVEKAQANTMEVRVVGEQFAWTFFYTNPEGGDDIGATELHLPVNRPVKFTLQSKDVLHDFWVPAFRMKKDAVPGINVTYRVTPNRIGRYPIVCAELCGLGHSTMRATAVVESEEAFAEFLETAANPPEPTPAAGGEPADGKQLFASNCGSCHTLGDAGTTGTAGPNLDESLPGEDVAAIRTSIVDPGAEVVDGFTNIMPGDYEAKLGAAGVDALAEYLSEVTKGG